MKYSIVNTAWGPVLFSGGPKGLKHLLLPLRRGANPHSAARKRWPDSRHDSKLFPRLQTQIRHYFQGKSTSFRVTLDLSERSEFQRSVLLACREIPFGQTVTYGELARLCGHPGAARAVGTVMAGNPIPFVIPCHRVLRSDRSLGGFSAPGGTTTKQRLLDLETQAIQQLSKTFRDACTRL